ncbi:large conductance mechanosensitive channel protein MscL [Phycisphaera mikurensis]|uniref:Large-conductance mechanosensitive channel n=1 Tax=Phycisphaera mikurensis (strain NBRC 102666 / KCTC 22515 / FYK2301M01) TaxID=1142394 RepID=I0IAC6_PHYMF|nr:large conductance mechanosensitive channel protein MscL [Phycisphaera mikurensis]MBB6441787.1 large conductance mechanosensitive channel [Phycisphaera mikurensis]BAM02214.1 large-conductance mechanosensitive channel [Phycisphaera mikurensis NBRC 102666]
MKIVQEFKEFILKGNMVDLAVGIVIGAAFSKVVTTLVGSVIMPPTAFLMGGVDLASKKTLLIEELREGDTHPVYQNTVEKDIPAVYLEWGAMLQALFELLVVGLAIFVVIKAINAMRKKQEEAPKEEPTPVEVELLRDIRDELRSRGGPPPA